MKSHQPTILIVDSDLSRAAPITEALSYEGFRIMPLTSAADALTLCRSKRFPVDLVVTNIAATPACGLQVAETIEREQLPIQVLFTSHLKKETLINLPQFQKFSDKLIENPTSIDELRTRVYHALKLQKAEES